MSADRGPSGYSTREFGRDAKVWDRQKIVIIPDHYIFTADSLSNRNVDILRDFVREQQLPYFYDVIDDPEGHWTFDAARGQLKRQYSGSFAGVCHTALPEKGHVRPGEVLFGTDSHTCMAGAFGEFATGIGNTDAGFILGTGQAASEGARDDALLPRRRVAEGRDGQGRDPACHRRDRLRRRDVPRDAVGRPRREQPWHGRPHDDHQHGHRSRRKNGIFAADQKTFDFVNARCAANGTKADYEPAVAGRNQRFVYDQAFDLSALEPTVAMHPNPGNRALAKTLGHVTLDRAYVGSCTGGKLSDFLAFAEIIKGKKVAIDTFGVPATPQVVDDLHKIQWDGKSVWQWLEDAGVLLTKTPVALPAWAGRWTPSAA